MKKSSLKALVLFCAVILVGILAATAVFADTAEDLPVTQSYVTSVLNALETKLNAKIESLLNDSSSEETSSSVSASYQVICLKQGQTIAGACEIILRSGSAIAVCPGLNGLSDLTDGSDIGNGGMISLNHLLLVPRDDGRGLLVTSGEAYIMVRGDYVVTIAE